jgi:ribosomal protein S18 acetylase RimI-like enzyme
MLVKQVNGFDKDFLFLSKCLEDFQFNLMPCLKEKGYSLTDDLDDIVGYILYDEEKPVASIGLKKVNDSRCEIVRVFVDENYRGKGLAKQLFKMIEEFAISLGYSIAEMVAWTKSESAVALYKKLGYKASVEMDSEWFVGLKYIEFEKELI